MNNQAQEAWKASYQLSKQARLLDRNQEADECLLECLRYRREAALERKLAAAQRRIEELEQDIDAFEQERNDLEAHIALTEFAKAEFSV